MTSDEINEINIRAISDKNYTHLILLREIAFQLAKLNENMNNMTVAIDRVATELNDSV